MPMAEGMGMHIIISLITLGIMAELALGQSDQYIRPTNCTETFDHSYSLDELLDQFRDDDIRWNLSKASPVFWSHPDLTIEYIYAALNHEDWQVRQVICHEIWQRQREKKIYHINPRKPNGDWNGGYYETRPGDPDYAVTADLVRVTIEGLKDDNTPYDKVRRRGLILSNAAFGTKMLIPIARQWANELIAAMDSDDGQQRYLAAYILARAGVAQSVERASSILLPHLRENDITLDAKFSVYALGGFGEELTPLLKQALPSADQQQRDLIMLLMLNITDPPITQADLIDRSRFNTITKNCYDPSQEPHRDIWVWVHDFER